MIEELRRALAPMQRQMRLLAGRAVLSLMSDAVSAQVKGLGGQPRDEVELFQQYGFRSQPLAGAEGVQLALGGSLDHSVVFCMDDRRVRFELKGGEVAMYTDEGDCLHFKRDNTVELKTKRWIVNAEDGIEFNTKAFSLKADSSEIDTPLLAVSGDIQDNAGLNSVTVAQLRDGHKGHTHRVTALNEDTKRPSQEL